MDVSRKSSWQSCIRRRFGLTVGLLSLLLAVSAEAEDQKPSGTVEISQVQIAFIGSGNLGGGTLHYQGKRYSFTIGGLGIGGFGISKMEAVGNVYNLKRLADFPGAFIQGRYGYAAGEAGGGELWLKNPNGVVLELKTKRQGLALSLGGDAVYINLD
jgi:hypothetical protein